MRAAQKGLKMSYIHPFGHHKWTGIIFGKPWFCPIFEPFVVPNWPIFKALSALRGAKITQRGLKMGSVQLVEAPPGAVGRSFGRRGRVAVSAGRSTAEPQRRSIVMSSSLGPTSPLEPLVGEGGGHAPK